MKIEIIPKRKLAQEEIDSVLLSRALGYLTDVLQSRLSGITPTTDLTTHEADTTTHGATGAIVGTTNTQALSGKTYNGLTLTAAATGFTIAGGTTSKTLTISNTLTLTATDSSTLAIGTGGTLGTAAYTATTAYEAAGGITTHAALTTGVHGAGASVLATTANIATHAALTTGVHGLAITAGQTLTVTTGGTLGSAAYTATTAYDAAGTTSTHAALTATHGVTGAIVGTTDTQELDNKTLDSSVAKGTWTASGTWALPSFSVASAGVVTGLGTGTNGITVKNIKNRATSALSGTQKDVEIDIGGVPYYFTVYPTKAPAIDYTGGEAGNGSAAETSVYGFPITITGNGQITSIGIKWASTEAGNVRVALYSAGSGKPASLLAESASTAIVTSAGWQDVTVSCTVTAGSYWVAIAFSAAKTVYYNVASRSYYTKSYGAFDATWDNSSTQDANAQFYMRVTYTLS